jgi:hypothetical protein
MRRPRLVCAALAAGDAARGVRTFQRSPVESAWGRVQALSMIAQSFCLFYWPVFSSTPGANTRALRRSRCWRYSSQPPGPGGPEWFSTRERIEQRVSALANRLACVTPKQ